jgi:hypothetical protein
VSPMPHAALHAISFVVAAGLLLAVGIPSANAQASRGAEARILDRALRLLPARPDVPVRLIEPELAADPDAIRRLDAFVVREPSGRLRRLIYLNSQSAMFQKALAGAALDVAILAAVIHHELEHLRGAGEAQARRAEREFFQRLVLEGQVATDEGLHHLADLELDRQLRESR